MEEPTNEDYFIMGLLHAWVMEEGCDARDTWMDMGMDKDMMRRACSGMNPCRAMLQCFIIFTGMQKKVDEWMECRLLRGPFMLVRQHQIVCVDYLRQPGDDVCNVQANGMHAADLGTQT